MFFSLHPSTASEALQDRSLAVVLPVYNERETIQAVLDEWRRALEALGISYVFVLVNDGSNDGTLDVLRKWESSDPARVLLLDKLNSGHGRSCRHGYEAAAASNVEWVLQIDSDGQCDPKYFAEFWAARDEADCVFGLRKSRDDGPARRWASRFCRLAASWVAGLDLPDPNVPYRMIRRQVLAPALALIPPAFDIHNVALSYVLRREPSLRWKRVPIHFRDRQGGSNSIYLPAVARMGLGMLLDLRKLRRRLGQVPQKVR